MREKKSSESLGTYAAAVRRALHGHVRTMLKDAERQFKPDWGLQAFADKSEEAGQAVHQYYLAKPVSATHVSTLLAAFAYEEGAPALVNDAPRAPETAGEFLARLMNFWSWNQDAEYPMVLMPVNALMGAWERLLEKLEQDQLHCELTPIYGGERQDDPTADAPSDLLGLSIVSRFDRLVCASSPIRLDLYWYGPNYTAAALKSVGVLV